MKDRFTLFRRTIAAFCAAVIALAALPGVAQDRTVPYWASIKVDEMYMRVGPSQNYKVSWVYKRKGLPLKVVRVIEGWRLVQDHEGTQGWVSVGLITAKRSAMVTGKGLAAMRDAPADNGRLKWNAEPGVVGTLGECEAGWCSLDVGGKVGWVRAERLWGAGEP
ncbi:MAG: SH3 domain-containing protein [Parerythrobacter sp.]